MHGFNNPTDFGSTYQGTLSFVVVSCLQNYFCQCLTADWHQDIADVSCRFYLR